ncbi:MAG: DUF3179 domain-containing protein [Alphaproteobacteria bacterium]|nr:DUF3179 domain-containing protein [Alphaproteobacteria bacterium]
MRRRALLAAIAAPRASASLIAAAAATGLADRAGAEPRRWAAEGWRTDFARHTVPLSEIFDGGPPRDGIPSIDRPHFVSAADLRDLAPVEPVIIFTLVGDTRAYPLRVLMWHEIVNDVVADTPVAVTYCPLCNTAMVFDRRVGGRALEFGTTGKLRHSDLVMYDRETDSWWQQFTGEAIAGVHAGLALRILPSRIAPLREFRELAPRGKVLVPSDPALRRYGANPYVGYDGRAQPYGLFQGELPRGMPAMQRVVLARRPEGRPLALDMALIVARRRVAHDGLVFAWREGMVSALDGAEIATSRDVGSVTVETADGAPVVHEVTFAFALLAFLPDVAVLTADGLVRLRDGVRLPSGG